MAQKGPLRRDIWRGGTGISLERFSTPPPALEHSANARFSKSSTSLDAIDRACARREGRPAWRGGEGFRCGARSARKQALDWLRAGYADGSLPHLKIPEERGDLATHRGRGEAPARRRERRRLPRHRRLEPRRPDAAAARRPQRSRHRHLARQAAPAFPRQPRPADLRRDARQAAAGDDEVRRDLEIRRHRRNADADHGRARCAEARRARSEDPRSAARPVRAGQARRQERPAHHARAASRCRCSITTPASADASRC